MGNSNSSNLSVGTQYLSFQEIIQEAAEYIHGKNKQNCICYNYVKNLHVICAAQYHENWKIDDLHTKELKEYVSEGVTKHMFKAKVYPNICDGCILVLLRRSVEVGVYHTLMIN